MTERTCSLDSCCSEKPRHLVCYSQVPGQYGELRVSNYSNVPGSRIGAATWTDNGAGLVYMFGGHCIDAQANISMCIDMFGGESSAGRD